MLFSNRTQEEAYLENEFLKRSKLERGKIDKIHKQYIESLKELDKINDKHTLYVCVESIYQHHMNWALHCIGKNHITRVFRDVLLNKKKEFLKKKGMFERKRN